MENEQVVPTEVAEETQVETPEGEVAEVASTTEPKVEVEDSVTEPPLIIPPPKKQTAQERIDELTRKRRDAEREAEYWRNLATKTPVEKPPEARTPVSTRPVISQFETTEAYEDALLEWHTVKRDTESRLARQKEDEVRASVDFNRKADVLRREYDDFDEVIETPVFTPVMRAALLRSDNGPEIAYFLGRPENRLTAEKIKSLPVESQLYELGKLEASLLVAKKTKKVPQAPPPITPVGMGSGGEQDPSKMSVDEWMAWDKKRTMERIQKKL